MCCARADLEEVVLVWVVEVRGWELESSSSVVELVTEKLCGCGCGCVCVYTVIPNKLQLNQ